MKRGDRVTLQPQTWHDGTPIQNWPDPQFLGTVLENVKIAGLDYVRVRYDSGRRDLALISRLSVVNS